MNSLIKNSIILSALFFFLIAASTCYGQLQLSDSYTNYIWALSNPLAVKKLNIQCEGCIIPECISNLVNLEELTIADYWEGEYTIKIPYEFYSLRSLKSMKFYGSKTDTFLPALKNLSKLEEIDVRSVLPPELGELKNLKKLSTNHLPDKITKANLPSLKRLYFRTIDFVSQDYFDENYRSRSIGYDIKMNVPKWVYQCDSLEEVNLRSLKCSDSLPKQKIWPNIKKLIVTEADTNILSGLTSLEFLDIQNCIDFHKIPAFLKNFKKLKTLKLLGIPYDVDFYSFFQILSALPALEELTVSFSWKNFEPLLLNQSGSAGDYWEYGHRVNLYAKLQTEYLTKKMKEFRGIIDHFSDQPGFFPKLKKLEGDYFPDNKCLNGFLSVFKNTNLQECAITNINDSLPPNLKKFHTINYSNCCWPKNIFNYYRKKLQNVTDIDVRITDTPLFLLKLNLDSVKTVKLTCYRPMNYDSLFDILVKMKNLEYLKLVFERATDTIILHQKFERLKQFLLLGDEVRLQVGKDFDSLLPNIDTLVAKIKVPEKYSNTVISRRPVCVYNNLYYYEYTPKKSFSVNYTYSISDFEKARQLQINFPNNNCIYKFSDIHLSNFTQESYLLYNINFCNLQSKKEVKDSVNEEDFLILTEWYDNRFLKTQKIYSHPSDKWQKETSISKWSSDGRLLEFDFQEKNLYFKITYDQNRFVTFYKYRYDH